MIASRIDNATVFSLFKYQETPNAEAYISGATSDKLVFDTEMIKTPLFSRRSFVRLGVGAMLSVPANRLLAQQGMGGHTAKPMPRSAPSGRPFNAHFVDIAADAGLHAPVIYGDEGMA